MTHPLEYLRIHCATDQQEQKLNAYIKHGTWAGAARELKCDESAVRRSVERLTTRATMCAQGPHFADPNGIPRPLRLKGTSTYKDGQWIKTDVDRMLYEQMQQEFAETFFRDSYAPLDVNKWEGSTSNDEDIPWFQIGDAHLGMLAYYKEVGQNFDLDIAAREITAAFMHLMDKAPKSKRCVINDLGDFTHYENFKSETEHSGHRLDADGRFPKMISVVSAVVRGFIQAALTKYEFVDYIPNQGNHSRTNDIWMRELIDVAYGHTGRVHALDNQGVFVPYKMGNTFVITHHSDKASGKKLTDVALTDYRDFLKECRHLYLDTGHVHHGFSFKEYALIQVESWNNLAANDKHHHEAGWRSKQAMSCAIRNRKYGQEDVLRVPIERIWDQLQAMPNVKTSKPIRTVYEV